MCMSIDEGTRNQDAMTPTDDCVAALHQKAFTIGETIAGGEQHLTHARVLLAVCAVQISKYG